MSLKRLVARSLLALASCGMSHAIAEEVSTATHVFRYTNPITRDVSLSLRDHYIIKVGPQWY